MAVMAEQMPEIPAPRIAALPASMAALVYRRQDDASKLLRPPKTLDPATDFCNNHPCSGGNSRAVHCLFISGLSGHFSQGAHRLL